MWQIELYRIDVQAQSFTRIAQIDDYQGLSFVQRRNGLGNGIFNMNIYSENAKPEYLIPFRTQVLVKLNGSYRWAGFINSVDFTMRDLSGIVKVELLEYWGHLSTRFTDKLVTYSDDAGDIAWSLINTTQNKTNGWLGINEGSIEATQNRDRTYESKNVFGAITDLTNVINGFDFDYTISTDSNDLFDGVDFNVYERLGAERTTTLELGENVQEVSGMLQSGFVNTVTGYGAGTGEDIIESSDSNSASQIGYTRKEHVLQRKDISLQDTLDQHVEDYVDDHSGLEYQYQLRMRPDTTPAYGSLNLGDRVNVKLVTDTGYLNVNRTAIIEEIGVDVDNNGVGFVTYTVQT